MSEYRSLIIILILAALGFAFVVYLALSKKDSSTTELTREDSESNPKPVSAEPEAGTKN